LKSQKAAEVLKTTAKQKVGSVAFSLPTEAVDRDSIENERRRIQIEAINRRIIAENKEKEKKEDKNNANKEKTE